MLECKISIKNLTFYLDISNAIGIGAYFLFGLKFFLLVLGLGKLMFYLLKKYPLYPWWAQAITFWCISYVIPSLFIPYNLVHLTFPEKILHIILFSVISGLILILLMDLLNGFQENISLKEMLMIEIKEGLFIDFIQIFIFAMLSFDLIFLWLHTPWAVPLLFIPFYGLKLVMENGQKIQAELAKTMNALNDILEAKDEDTEKHTERVSKYAVITAKHYGGFSDEQLDLIEKVGKLHDVGKILVRDDVLKKPGKLTPEEYEHIKLHVQKDFVTDTIPPEYPLAKWLQLARLHHERYDGKGYPFGLKGEEILIELRIISVADAWDAMTTRRVYRASLANDTALQTLKEGAGTQWDPTVINAFFKAYDSGEIQALQAEHKAKLQKQKWDALQKLDQYLSLESSL